MFSKAAPTYDAVGPRFFTHFAERLVGLVGPKPGSEVLDVATGTGAVLLHAAEAIGVGGQVIGVDLTPAMLERARAEVDCRGFENAELRLMDALELEFEDESFDYAFCAFAFVLLPDPARALAELYRVLRPGGRLGLANTFGWFHQHDPAWQWEGELLESYGIEAATKPPPLDLAKVEALARDEGFVGIESVGERFPLVFSDVEQWWQWAWSHSYRVLFEAVDPKRLDALRQELFAGLERCKDSEGYIRGSFPADLTVARKR